MPTGRNPNSSDAYQALEMTKRKQAVYDLLDSSHPPLTDKAIKEALGFRECTGIITEMIMDGTVQKIDDILCPETGARVRRVHRASNEPRHEIVVEISVVDRDIHDRLIMVMNTAIGFLKQSHPHVHVRGRLKIKYGSRHTYSDLDRSDGPRETTDTEEQI